MKKCRRIKKGWQDNAEYERLDIQEITNRETGRSIYWSILYQWNNIYKCGQITTA